MSETCASDEDVTKSLQNAAAEKEKSDGAVSSWRLLSSDHGDTRDTSCFVRASTTSRRSVLTIHWSFSTLHKSEAEAPIPLVGTVCIA